MVVREFALAQGQTLLAGHVTGQGYELDCVFRQGDRIAICEVRVRQTRRGPAAIESLATRKQEALRRGASAWLAGLPSIPPAWHFHIDLVTLEPHPEGGWALTWVPDAVEMDR